MNRPSPPLSPAFYVAAVPPGERRPAWVEWWVLLHPPYTLWHLSYVAIGACVAPRFEASTLAATLLAFLLAVGICAHALDEMHGRPLRTRIPGWQLATAAASTLAGAVALGIVGIARVGPGLAVFIAVGVVLTCGYNLELVGGRLHNDTTFALAWGSFPALTAYYAQAHSLSTTALFVALGCFLLSNAQRALSTPARQLRRRVAAVHGETVFRDGHHEPLTTTDLLAPLETALRATAFAVTALAVGLVLFRLRSG